MTLDFALILVGLTAVTGLIWLLDAVLLQKPRRRKAAGGGAAKDPILVEYAKSFFPILLLVLLLRSFLFEPFRIPSGSMMPTLLEGDFIFVNKFAYGLRLPVLNTKIVEIGAPKRGDVVVFRLPSDPSVNYIKRVVGLPGDVVDYDQGNRRLTINGMQMPVEMLGDYEDGSQYRLGRENLDGVTHSVLFMPANLSRGGVYRVPEGHYFMMGDNRDNSQDSRWEKVGLVPENRLVGRASRIWMNWKWTDEGGPEWPQWSRIGQGIE